MPKPLLKRANTQVIKQGSFALKPTRHRDKNHADITRISAANTTNTTLSMLLDEIRTSVNPDPTLLLKVVEACFTLADVSTCTNSHRFRYYGLALFEWIEKNHTSMATMFTAQWPDKALFFAKAYLEIWKRQGIRSEAYVLTKARQNFEEHFLGHPGWPHSRDYIDFIRCLIYDGTHLLFAEHCDRYASFLTWIQL